MLIKRIKASIKGLIKRGNMKICPQCKSRVLNQAKVCPNCGYNFKEG